ncbi:UNVERIFIED_CONTAM: hypothetical protein Sangu_3203000 [Sesamum angustifolium]|uniref:Reverse transcriptase domain-containing protein n=1 Tax=Sesamum angustifolium TaxID=2727405 RepID=A0AAW2JMK3_9LAMI
MSEVLTVLTISVQWSSWCLISVLYGDYDIIPRRELWAALQSISVTSCEEPWIVLGDFNAIIDASEACGRAADTTASMTEFRNCIQATGLIHIPFNGCPFTWHNCSEGTRSLWKRLDRVLVNAVWLELWPNSSYTCALPSTSDHSPLILNAATGGTTHSLFRFDNFLAKQSGFLDSVSNTWRHNITGTAMYGVVCKLKTLKATFRQQRKFKGNLTDNVRRAKGFLDKAQELFAPIRSDFLLRLVKCCRHVYSVAINLETSMLRQRAKLQWLRHGDQNSRIFFRKINARRARQRVFQVTKANGEVLTDMNEVTEEFVSCFKSLLGGIRSQRDINLSFLQQGIKHRLTQEEAELISAPVTQTEIKEAMFDIDEDSAPGPDGYTSGFFKSAWLVVGADICEAVQEFFRSGKLLKQLNATLLVLIPKVSDYRPIACCNVLYKTITKIIVKRMQLILHLLIDYSQNAFVPGRSISDNILLAQELLAGYNQAKLPPRCTIKVDLKKAYDSVEWDFLTEVIKDALCEFAVLSGLNVNPAKSQIILSRAAQQDKQQLLDLLGFQEGVLPVKYLGVPLTSSRLTIADCRPLLSNLESRLEGWNQLTLSFAARTLLIKSVLSTLHSYWASVFILPKGIIKIIEARVRKFLWQGSTGRGYAKVAWEQICKPKEEGGLGIRSISVMNQALMLKHLWKLVHMDRSSIWVDWILQYRLRNSTIWSFTGATGSWGWKKMLKLKPILRSGLIYRVGNGNSFKLWKDVWHELGPLCLSYPGGPTATGLPLDASLSCVIRTGQWHWPSQTDPVFSEIAAGLPPIYPTEPDSIIWRNSSGIFTVQSAIPLIQPPAPIVNWHVLLHGRYQIAKHCFILWRCLAILYRRTRFQWPYHGWQQGIAWASQRWRSKHILHAASRATLAALVYHLWIERNNRRFNATATSAESLVFRVMEDVRMRILSDTFIPSLQTRALYRLWKIAWPQGY